MAKKTNRPTDLVPSGGGARFSVGSAVRVRAGTIDPDFPDIPLSGWAGVVAECDETSDPLYLVRWTPETLARIAPAYWVRCDREGLDAEETWILGRDLVPDAGGPLEIIAPKKLKPRPLDRDNPEDRVRAIFGLTTDDRVPAVNPASLRHFHEYFTRKLTLPQPALIEGGPAHELAVLRQLLPLEEEDLDEGLLVEVTREDAPETVPLADVSLLVSNDIGDDVLAYGEWFVNAVPDGPASAEFPHFGAMPNLQLLLGRILLGCLLLGALFGAILWAHAYAVSMAQWGGLAVGFLGLVIGARSEAGMRRTFRRPPGFLIGLLLGSMLGLVLGAVGAVLLLGFLWAIPGAILGSLLGQLLSACGVRNHSTVRLTFLGAYLGAGISAFQLDTEAAISGSAYGFLGGAGVFLLGYALMSWVRSRLPRP